MRDRGVMDAVVRCRTVRVCPEIEEFGAIVVLLSEDYSRVAVFEWLDVQVDGPVREVRVA